MFLHRAPSGPRTGPRPGHGWASCGPRRSRSNGENACWNTWSHAVDCGCYCDETLKHTTYWQIDESQTSMCAFVQAVAHAHLNAWQLTLRRYMIQWVAWSCRWEGDKSERGRQVNDEPNVKWRLAWNFTIVLRAMSQNRRAIRAMKLTHEVTIIAYTTTCTKKICKSISVLQPNQDTSTAEWKLTYGRTKKKS